MKNPFKNNDIDEVKEETAEDVQEESTDTAEEQEEKNEETDNNSETEKLKSDYETLNAQYMRLAADFENYRKRQEGEREALLRFGTENALKKMLEVLDNFERANKALENIDDIEKYKESFLLLQKQTKDALNKIGLEEIEAEGKEFDPNFHDAVMQTPTEEYAEHMIIAELQKGYKFGDKVLRPALVNVATAP